MIRSGVLRAALLLLTIAPLAFAQSKSKTEFARSERLERLARDAVARAVDQYGKGGLTPDKIAVTIIDMGDRDRPKWASHRGQEMIYPASVVKLFYLAAAHHQLETGALKQSAELERALRDMIVDSSNDATHYVVDAVTNTTGGPELDDAQLAEWKQKRNLVNRYFADLGYEKINVNQKTWCEAPYGRERQGLGPNFEYRNKLTTEAVARLFYDIAAGRAVSNARSRQMMGLLRRDPQSKPADSDDQDTAYAGKSLPRGSEYYAKAGWTSTTRHDAAYIRLPGGAEYILVVFTVDNSAQADIIPFVSRTVAEDFSRTQPRADLVLTNGRVWTGNKAQPWAEAVASRGERIIQVGSNEDARKLIGPQTRVIDLQGKLALPGFIRRPHAFHR